MEWLTLENVPAQDQPLCLGISVLAFLVIWAIVAIRERRKKRNCANRGELAITSVVVADAEKPLPELAVGLVDGRGKAWVVAGYMAAPCAQREEKRQQDAQDDELGGPGDVHESFENSHESIVVERA